MFVHGFGLFLIGCLIVFIVFGVIPEIFIWLFGSKRSKFYHNFDFECGDDSISRPRRYLVNYIKKNRSNYYDYEDAFIRVSMELPFKKDGSLDLLRIPEEFRKDMEEIYKWSDKSKRKYDNEGNRIY